MPNPIFFDLWYLFDEFKRINRERNGSVLCAYIILVNFFNVFYIPMIYEVDKVAGNFANDLRTGISRKKYSFLNLFILSILLFIIEFISILVMILVGLEKVEFNYISTVLCFLIGTIMLMPMIPVYQF